MLVRVPFSYTARVVGKGKRSPSIEDFWEWTDLEVAEPDDSEAPVALRWRDSFPGDGFAMRHNWGLFPLDGICESRWFEGSHWTPVLAEDMDTRSSAERVGLESLAAKCRAGDDYNNPFMNSFHLKREFGERPEGRPLIPGDYRSAENSTRDSEIEALRAKAAKLISVHGTVWQRSAEPVLYLKEWVMRNHNIQAAIKVLPCDSRDIKDPCAVYRADRFDEAALGAIPGVEADYDLGVNDGREVEVLIPESLSYRDEELAFEHVAAKLVARWADKPIKSFDNRTALAWLSLSRACASNDEEKHELIEAALEDYAIVADEDGARWANAAIGRWRSRPIGMDDGYAAAPGPR